MLVSALDEVAWLFNVRGGDVEFNPVTIAYAGPFFPPEALCVFLLRTLLLIDATMPSWGVSFGRVYTCDGPPVFLSTQTNKYAYICSGDPRGGHAVRGRPQALAGGKGGLSVSQPLDQSTPSVDQSSLQQSNTLSAGRSINRFHRSINHPIKSLQQSNTHTVHSTWAPR